MPNKTLFIPSITNHPNFYARSKKHDLTKYKKIICKYQVLFTIRMNYFKIIFIVSVGEYE